MLSGHLWSLWSLAENREGRRSKQQDWTCGEREPEEPGQKRWCLTTVKMVEEPGSAGGGGAREGGGNLVMSLN